MFGLGLGEGFFFFLSPPPPQNTSLTHLVGPSARPCEPSPAPRSTGTSLHPLHPLQPDPLLTSLPPPPPCSAAPEVAPGGRLVATGRCLSPIRQGNLAMSALGPSRAALAGRNGQGMASQSGCRGTRGEQRRGAEARARQGRWVSHQEGRSRGRGNKASRRSASQPAFFGLYFFFFSPLLRDTTVAGNNPQQRLTPCQATPGLRVPQKRYLWGTLHPKVFLCSSAGERG